MSGYNSFKDIKKSLDKINITNIVNILKYKLCSHCKDGHIEVDDKQGLDFFKITKGYYEIKERK